MVKQSTDYKLVERLADHWLRKTYLVHLDEDKGNEIVYLTFALKNAAKIGNIDNSDFKMIIEGIWKLETEGAEPVTDTNALVELIGGQVQSLRISGAQTIIMFSSPRVVALTIEEREHIGWDDWSIGWSMYPTQTVMWLQGGAEGDYTVRVEDKFTKLLD